MITVCLSTTMGATRTTALARTAKGAARATRARAGNASAHAWRAWLPTMSRPRHSSRGSTHRGSVGALQSAFMSPRLRPH